MKYPYGLTTTWPVFLMRSLSDAVPVVPGVESPKVFSVKKPSIEAPPLQNFMDAFSTLSCHRPDENATCVGAPGIPSPSLFISGFIFACVASVRIRYLKVGSPELTRSSTLLLVSPKILSLPSVAVGPVGAPIDTLYWSPSKLITEPVAFLISSW